MKAPAPRIASKFKRFPLFLPSKAPIAKLLVSDVAVDRIEKPVSLGTKPKVFVLKCKMYKIRGDQMLNFCTYFNSI